MQLRWDSRISPSCFVKPSRCLPAAHPTQRSAVMSRSAGREGETILQIRPYESRDEQAVISLWTDCGLVVPWNDPRRDIQRKLRVQPETFLVAFVNAQLVATVMAGYDGHRGWINYLAVHPAHRRHGLGRRMMEEAERRLRAVGCPKINLQVRSANADAVQFYKRIGFEEDDVRSFGKRLEHDG